MTSPSETALDEAEIYRREAMGAFAHEARTPLTSIRMVLELARRLGSGGDAVLDAELAAMLTASVDDLQRLVDELQEMSRLERGKLALSPGPCDLRAAVDAARELVSPAVSIDGAAPATVEGPWDSARLVHAIAGFARAVNRIGDGGGAVALDCSVLPGGIEIVLSSGQPHGPPREIAADAGFGFFRARQLVIAMGGSVDCARADRYARVRVGLPLPQGYSA